MTHQRLTSEGGRHFSHIATHQPDSKGQLEAFHELRHEEHLVQAPLAHIFGGRGVELSLSREGYEHHLTAVVQALGKPLTILRLTFTARRQN